MTHVNVVDVQSTTSLSRLAWINTIGSSVGLGRALNHQLFLMSEQCSARTMVSWQEAQGGRDKGEKGAALPAGTSKEGA